MNGGMPVVEGEGSMAPVIATVVVLGLLVLGGLYFLNVKNESVEERMEQAVAVDESAAVINTQDIETQSNSDETSSIEDDLNRTNTTSADSALYVQ